jgi:hypothetical protein
MQNHCAIPGSVHAGVWSRVVAMSSHLVSPISAVMGVSTIKSRDQILVDSDGKKSVVRDVWEVFLYDRHGSKYSISNVYTVDFKV